MTMETLVVTVGRCILSSEVNDMPLLSGVSPDDFVYGKQEVSRPRTITMYTSDEFYNYSNECHRANITISPYTRIRETRIASKMFIYGVLPGLLQQILTLTSVQPFATNMLREWFLSTVLNIRTNVRECDQRLSLLAEISSKLNARYPDYPGHKHYPRMQVMKACLHWAEMGTLRRWPSLKGQVPQHIFCTNGFRMLCDFALHLWQATLKRLRDSEMEWVLAADWKDTRVRHLLTRKMNFAYAAYLQSVNEFIEAMKLADASFRHYSQLLQVAKGNVVVQASAFMRLANPVSAMIPFLQDVDGLAADKQNISFVCVTHQMQMEVLELLTQLKLRGMYRIYVNGSVYDNDGCNDGVLLL